MIWADAVLTVQPSIHGKSPSEILSNNSDLYSRSSDKQPKCHRLEEVPVCAGFVSGLMSNDFWMRDEIDT